MGDKSDSNFLELFENAEFDDDLFSIFESLENDPVALIPPLTPLDDQAPLAPIDDHQALSNCPAKDVENTPKLVSQKSNSSTQHDSETEHIEASSSAASTPRSRKRGRISVTPPPEDGGVQDGQHRIMHITVERNRRKQMNEHLSVLRTLMPNFYVKRGDQASIIGGVVDYIKELQQVLQSLEAKKQRKVYSEVLSPRIVSSPRPSTLISSPRKPPLSPRISLPISPRTPQPSSPYKPRTQQVQQQLGYNLPSTISATATTTTTTTSLEPCLAASAPSSSSSTSLETNIVNELAANPKSSVADVEVKFSGPNVLLKTVSPKITGQALKIIAAIEALSLEILHVSINVVDKTMVNSFTIKIGIECQLSAEDLVHEIQKTFC